MDEFVQVCEAFREEVRGEIQAIRDLPAWGELQHKILALRKSFKEYQQEFQRDIAQLREMIYRDKMEKRGLVKLQEKQSASLCYEHRAAKRTRQDAKQEQAIAVDECEASTVKLFFLNTPKTPIYTNKNITAESNEDIRIAILKGGQKITSGPLSSLTVEVVALPGDFANDGRGSWTQEEFDRHIACSQDGHRSVLDGNLFVKLVDGEASLGHIWFKEGSARTRTGKFVIAGRVSRSENTGCHRVQEAVMYHPVTVWGHRNKHLEKSHPPKLNDGVYHLEQISKNGVFMKRLQEQNISTVQDFLKALNKNEHKLHEILRISSLKSWQTMVRHARECDLKDNLLLKPYVVADENVVLFFNCVHDLVGATFDNNYVVKDRFDPAQQLLVNKLKGQAHNVLESIKLDHWMEDNRPVSFRTHSTAARCPALPVSGVSQPNPSDRYTAWQGQGTAAVDNLDLAEINHVTDNYRVQGWDEMEASASTQNNLQPNKFSQLQ